MRRNQPSVVVLDGPRASTGHRQLEPGRAIDDAS
jgi:hypothetical protein